MNLLDLIKDRNKKFSGTFLSWFLSSDVHPSFAILAKSRVLLAASYAATIKKELIIYLSNEGKDFLSFLKTNHVGLVITTDQLSDMTGEEMIKQALKVQPKLRTMLLIEDNPSKLPIEEKYESPVIIAERDLLTEKYAFRAALLAAIGNACYRSDSVPRKSDRVKDENNIILSELEQKMLEYFAQGLTLQEITLKTNHTQSTIKTYSRNLLQKLGVNNRQKALLRAIQIGLLRPRNNLRA